MKLVSLNIERSRHLHDRVLPFLQQEKPDVLALQELCLKDIPLFEDFFGQAVFFAPMCRDIHPIDPAQTDTLMGVGLVATTALAAPTAHYYRGNTEHIPIPQAVLVPGTEKNYITTAESLNQVAVSGTVGGIRFMTSHLLVTARGESTPEQRAMATRLLQHAQTEAIQHSNLLLCGDFNAPRGRATWAMLAEALTDRTPAEWQTTLDANLHRAGALPYVVDGVFTRGEVPIQTLEQRFGVSDHCAMIINII